MDNKKGFTLVEVLAVIVILGLIGAIIAPKVINTIKNAKKNSYNVSVNNLVQALNGAALDKKANLISFNGCSYDFDNNSNTCIDLEYSGELPTSGSISVDKDGHVNGSVVYGDNNFLIINNNVKIELLPKEYIRVDYIESTGTQYIDTGVIANQDTGFDIKFKTNDSMSNVSSEYGAIFGARESSTINELQLTTFAGTPMYFGTLRYGTGSSYTAGFGDLSTVQHVSLKNKVYIGNSGTRLQLSKTFTTPVPITIFALNQNGNKIQYGKLLLYNFTLYDGDVLIRDFLPCYRKSDSVIGLYDVVNDRFYTNSGTGEFLISD